MSKLADDFSSLPPEYQDVLRLAQDRHNIEVVPLQELKGGRTGAHLYLVSVSSAGADQGQHPGGHLRHFVLKLDHKSKKTKMDELERHQTALSQAPPEFARHHLADLAFDRVELKGAVAIFYSIAGQSLHHYRSLASYQRQSKLELLFSTTNEVLLAGWNAALTFEQVLHPQTLLARWLGYRLQPGGNIEHFLEDVCHIPQDTAGLLIQGQVFPNPLLYARERERWGAIRPIDAMVGFQHGDLNIGNILARFSENEAELAGYYLIDFALFKAHMPLLYDQRYLEMSYLIRELSRAPFPKWVDLVTRFAGQDIVDPQQVPIELAGACAVIAAGRRAFDAWVQASYPSLADDLWGQFWLAGVAVGLNYCNKAMIPEGERLAGLIFAAAHLKRYHATFGVSLPVEIKHLYDASQTGEVARADAVTQFPTAGPAHNLPAQPTPFIGRQQEVAAARDLLLRPEVRLVTLTGPGGTGKTRLSLQVATELLDHFDHGVFLVPLADITDPDLVISKIAQQLALREAGSRPLLEILKDYLRDKQILLLLDNFEQVVDAAPVVADLLATAPGSKVLVTSRIRLNLRGEHEFPVPPLKLPDLAQLPSVERLSQYEAIRLFIERAQVARASFAINNENAPAVAEICHRLDGLPLAIELAAARVRLLSPQAMLTRLSSRLKLLTGGAQDLPARQQTLRNTIDWSYSLLNEDEQTLFARLAVFVGGFTLEAAEAVCNPESNLDVLGGVESLMNNSLLRQDEARNGQPRFRSLETIREYALERLEASGEAADLRRQHAHYFAKWVDEMGLKLASPEAGVLWVDLIEEEYDNLRAVLTWSQATPERLELGPGLVFSLLQFWFQRGHISEGRAWSDRILASPAAQEPSRARGMALLSSGAMALWQGDPDTARTLVEESVAIWPRVEKGYGLALALLINGLVLLNQGNETAARPLVEECLGLSRELGYPWIQTMALVSLGNVALGVGDFAEAGTWFAEALSLGREVGDKRLTGLTLNNLGEVARLQGDYARAYVYYKESEASFREVGEQLQLARLTHSLGYVAWHQGDLERAQALFQESLAMFRILGNNRGLAECLAGLAGLAANQGRSQRAARLLGAAEALLRASGGAWWPADRVEYERNLATIRAALTEEAFAAAWAEGQAMTQERAIAYASE
jgi:predicted ATPase